MKNRCTGCGKESNNLCFTYITDPDLYCLKCRVKISEKYCLRYGKRDGCCKSLLNKGICPGHLKYVKDKKRYLRNKNEKTLSQAFF